MALDFGITQWPFTYGLAEGVDPHQTPPGTLLTAENVVWRQHGRLEKRFGSAALTTTVVGGGNVSAAKRLFNRAGELTLIDGASCFAYAPTFGGWKNLGKVPNVGLTWTTLVDTSGGVSSYDSAVSSGGVRVDAWTVGAVASVLFVQVVDAASGTRLVAPVRKVFGGVTGAIGVRVVTIGTTAIVLTNVDTNIVAFTVDLSTLMFSANTNLRTDFVMIDGGTGFDACVIGSNFVLAYTATGPLLKLYSYNASLTQQATGGITGETTGARAVSIDGSSGGVLYVGYVSGPTVGINRVKLAIANPTTLLQSVAPTTVETLTAGAFSGSVGLCQYDASSCVLAYYTNANTVGVSGRAMSYRISSTGVVDVNSERGTWSASPASRPFMSAGTCYMLVVTLGGSGERNTSVVEIEVTARVAAFTPHRLVGTVDVLLGGSSVDLSTPVPNVSAFGGTMTAPVAFLAGVYDLRQGLRLVTLSFGSTLPTDMYRSVLSGSESYSSGGILSALDGRSVFDYGFQSSPLMPTPNPTTGGSIVNGQYLYGGVLEYRSAAGVLHRSPTNTTLAAITLTGTLTKVLVTLSRFQLANKQTAATLFGVNTALPTAAVIYRSTINGPTYYRLWAGLYADQELEVATYPDTSSDSGPPGGGTLGARPAIYTTGGILDDYAPPGNVTMFGHVDRLWVLAGDLRTWWFSKAFQDDLGVAPGFHPNFRVTFDAAQTAGVGMDDRAIFFSATGIAYMQGLGPAPNGSNSDFGPATRIQTDAGCINARSIVSTPDGIMFQSARGLYLLSRGLEVVWIGRAMRNTLAAYPVITSAVLVASQNQVRFTCNSVDGLSGIVIVYDYVEKQWATARYTAGGTYGTPFADACMWNGTWTFVTPSGVVQSESTTTFLDNGEWVPMTLETAWVTGPSTQVSPSSGPLKFQSVRSMQLHGRSSSDHDLTVQVGFDSETAYVQTLTTPAQSAVTAVDDLEDWEVVIGTRRKCNAIRFRISDSTPSSGALGTGKGPSFDTMGLDLALKRGFGNTPANKKA